MKDAYFQDIEDQFKELNLEYKAELLELMNAVSIKLQLIITDPFNKKEYYKQIKQLRSIITSKLSQARSDNEKLVLQQIAKGIAVLAVTVMKVT